MMAGSFFFYIFAGKYFFNVKEQENEEKYTYHIDDVMHDVCCAYGFFGTDRC